MPRDQRGEPPSHMGPHSLGSSIVRWLLLTAVIAFGVLTALQLGATAFSSLPTLPDEQAHIVLLTDHPELPSFLIVSVDYRNATCLSGSQVTLDIGAPGGKGPFHFAVLLDYYGMFTGHPSGLTESTTGNPIVSLQNGTILAASIPLVFRQVLTGFIGSGPTTELNEVPEAHVQGCIAGRVAARSYSQVRLQLPYVGAGVPSIRESQPGPISVNGQPLDHGPYGLPSSFTASESVVGPFVPDYRLDFVNTPPSDYLPDPIWRSSTAVEATLTATSASAEDSARNELFIAGALLGILGALFVSLVQPLLEATAQDGIAIWRGFAHRTQRVKQRRRALLLLVLSSAAATCAALLPWERLSRDQYPGVPTFSISGLSTGWLGYLLLAVSVSSLLLCAAGFAVYSIRLPSWLFVPILVTCVGVILALTAVSHTLALENGPTASVSLDGTVVLSPLAGEYPTLDLQSGYGRFIAIAVLPLSVAACIVAFPLLKRRSS